MIMSTGILTSIQRFSLNDGPGIRTTVFFKGCNMTCAWCHNPETLSSLPELLFYPEHCEDCRASVAACRTGALRYENSQVVLDRSLCDRNGACADVSYDGAFVMAGRTYEAGEVLDEILQDALYYRNSGGGITLSGGEAVLQAEFAGEILRLCQAEGIQTALETNLNYPFSWLDGLLPWLNLVMADLKMMDEARHREMTGVTNQLILENIRLLDGSGIPYIIRTPVIPGVNDTAEDIEACGRFLEPLHNLQYYELLNFNPLGDSKYAGLGRVNPFRDAKPLPDAAMGQLRQSAARHLRDVRIG